ncbi:MAG TPA: D-aminoacyl-tRNA deacylase [Candidatus Limnocylindrales bacterium]|nr:D-aminoacyl-tRNA deacylase [Candidatus Limnocylindrales bacterium]
MKALLQRVSRAAVRVDGEEVASIGKGLLILLGVSAEDHPGFEERLAARCAEFRIFEDEQGKMNQSVGEIGGQALVVPQFTLVADVARGRRPSFTPAASPEAAERAFTAFCAALAARDVPTKRGRFGASMEVELVNQGPATFLLEITAS